MPSAAMRELMNDADGLALDVMELRAYSRTKEAIDRATDAKEMPQGPMVEWVFEIEAELLRRRREAE